MKRKMIKITMFSAILLSVFISMVFITQKEGFFNSNINLSKNKIKSNNSKVKLIKCPSTIYLNNIAIDVFQNDSIFKGDILVLPGWNFKRNIWCDSSNLCELAVKIGYRVIMPEMGKSIYSSSFYPETRKEWKKYPDLNWITDSLIPFMQKKYGVFVTKKNYMLGLSTGARGVILIGIKTDTLFTKGAALSGDYNQTRLPNDNLVRGYYGQYSKFKKRWEDIDNPTRQSKNIKFDLYLGHGKIDKVVDYSQTTELYDSVMKNNRSINVKLSIQSKMGHNFSYWRSEVNNVLMFFEK